MSKGGFVEIDRVAKRYGETTIFEDLSLSLGKGEFVCLVGHSGCGKSSLLNIVAGLDDATEGYVFVDDREVTAPSLDHGVIFQNHSLLPWKSAIQNVTLSVRARWPKWSRAKVKEHSLSYIEMVGLGEAQDRRPSQLSGGMRQRVGIARAFAIQPRLLLMDEPFGALDALTRGQIQDELLRVWSRSGQTVMMITHDVDEAIYLADRVLLMSSGPNAEIAESVVIDIERPRDRRKIIHEARYYEIRNQMVDFLVSHGANRRDATEPAEAPAEAKLVTAPPTPSLE